MNIKSSKKLRIKIDNKEPQNECINSDDISLESLGAFMLFKSIDVDSAEDFCEFIIKSNFIFSQSDPLTILINSPGGSVYDGFGMIDLMEISRLKIKTVAIGSVASMGALIFTAGSKGMRVMTKNSFIMTHQFSSYFEGKYHELIANRQHEDLLHTRFIDHFLKHSKMSKKQIETILLGSSDAWLDAKTALKYGLCDKIQENIC